MALETTITRRQWVAETLKAAALATGATVLAARLARAEAPPTAITVYKDPSCGCCNKWVTHLGANGFKATGKDRSDMDALKDSLGVPAALRSCHTAVSGKFVFEGHVPARDVKRFIASAPKGMIGLAVPGMPSGSPGMETPGRTDRYEVIAFGAGGKTRVFATHG